MEKRIFTAVLISIGFLWLWAYAGPKLFPEYFKQPAKTAPATPSTTTTANRPPAPAPVPAPAPESRPAPVTVAPTTATRRQLSRIETKDFIAIFSNRGAELISFQLKHYQSKSGAPVELVKGREPIRTDFPFAIESPNAAVAQGLNTALWEVAQNNQTITYRYAGEGVAATKTFSFAGDYPFTFAVSVAPAIPYRVAIGPGIRTLEPDEKESMYVVTGNGVVQRDEKVSVVSREKSDRVNVFDHVDFIGIEDNYFFAALRPTRGDGAILHASEFGAEKRRDFYAAVNALQDGKVEGTAYFLPKQTQLVDRFGLEKTLQFGMFGIIARAFLTALLWLNKFIHNFGWSIIALTFIIKILLYPLQHKSMTSMKKMQAVQPKVEAIKAKYRKVQKDPEQRQKMNMETMKLYQQEGINPASGCLPLVIQLPILWAFYNLLSHAIELRGAPFMLWLHDLSAKDPYYITPALMVVTMFVQQAMTPTTVDPAQKRMFYIMPLVMGWIFKELPSGVVIYYLMQNVLTIIQQW
ncbi:MAG TPA: membrane protein insertase YidC, partial [Thermoanaerobaculia bacterium]|nr:membrane protein insertase YidC [Thermoanaerobaculia bacterium]